MKLVVLIPAYNEAETIAEVIGKIPGVEQAASTEIVVLDDASDDGTPDIARAEGARVLRAKQRVGLASQFRKGLDEALRLGADLVVSLDADMEHDPRELPGIVEPIIQGEADIVLGSRFSQGRSNNRSTRKLVNLALTSLVNFMSGTKLTDTQTGFRAYSREAAAKLDILSSYTYTQEVIIQASHKGLKIVEVPISFKKRRGHSRLFKSRVEYAFKTLPSLFLTCASYRPFRMFLPISLTLSLLSLALASIVFVQWPASQFFSCASFLTLSAILFTFAFIIIVLAILTEMNRVNRELIEDLLFRQKYRLNR